ncbi:MAG: phosphatidylglycerophosphatase A [Acidobacteriota bacterium]
MNRLARHLATVGRLAEVLPAPGTTVGSVAGVLLFWGAAVATGRPLVAAIAGLVLLVPLALWSGGVEAVRRAQSDPGPVVIDEVAGQWLALALLVAAQPRPLSLGLVAGSFLLFRLFDVVKPWPIGRLERLPGGWGILADDLAAGLAAGLVHLAVLAWL